MQVLMPMTAPIMMPMSEHNVMQKSNDMVYANMFDTVPQQSWPADGAYSFAAGYFNQEDDAPHFPAQYEYKEDLPSQVHMDMMTTALAGAAIGVGSLRRRQRKGHSAEAWQTHIEPMCKMEETCAPQEDGTEAEQSQEIANNVLSQMHAGGCERQSALTELESLCFANRTTSKAAQLALQQASSSDAIALAKALRGHVRSAVQSKHANYVLQTIIEVTPPACASFIVDELKGFARKIARQQFGCRVLCRLLEHLPTDDQSNFSELFDEILKEDVHELCRNEFGSYVVRHLLEFGFAHHKHKVVNALLMDLLGHSKDKFGSHVVEIALRHSSQEDQHDLARQLLKQRVLLELASGQFGRHVARALLGMHGDIKREAVEMLLPVESRLRSMRYGKSIVQCLRVAAKGVTGDGCL